MPKRTSSKHRDLVSRSDRDLHARDSHAYANNSPLPKFADKAAIASEPADPIESARNLRKSQAGAIERLGRSLGYAEKEIAAAVAPTGEPKHPHKILEDEIDEIGPIIDAVGLPLETSKEELSHDIGLAEALFWALGDTKALRKRKDALSSIETAARRLKTALSNEVAWRAVIPHLRQPDSADSADLSFSPSSLDMLIGAASKAQNLEIEPNSLPSASDMIVARLFEVYERHFASSVTTSRPNDAEKQTPYLLFIKLVLEKTGLPKYDIETIIRATSKARKAKRAHAA